MTDYRKIARYLSYLYLLLISFLSVIMISALIYPHKNLYWIIDTGFLAIWLWIFVITSFIFGLVVALAYPTKVKANA